MMARVSMVWRLGRLLLLAAALFSSSSAVAASPLTPDPDAVHITILHLNDCYELMPTSGTDLGGVSRVATLRKQLLAANPNTITMLAGDLFAPSALGTVPVPNAPGGEGLNGLQMVAGMNAIGVEWACLGNHDVDVKAKYFTANLAASNFTWLSANAEKFHDATGHPYPNLGKSTVIEKTDPSNGRSVKIGVFGLTIDSTNKDFESYMNFSYSANVVARQAIEELKNQQANIVVALTHWEASQDRQMVEETSGIAIVVGGHEHVVIEIEDTPAPIYKAQSNVRSVWVHEMYIDTSVPESDPQYFLHYPRLVYINSSLEMDPDAQAAVQPYINKAFASFAVSGFNATEPVALLNEPLDLSSESLQNGPMPSSTWLVQSIYASAVAQLQQHAPNLLGPGGHVDAAIMNVGTLRLDDTLDAGTEMVEYTVLRIVPFLNQVQVAEISGDLLERVLNIGVHARATSQYLAHSNITLQQTTNSTNFTTNHWFINGKNLSTTRNYTLAITDYLCGLNLDAGPAPYQILNAHASPNDMRIIYASRAGDPLADPRGSFMSILRATYPLPNPPSGSAVARDAALVTFVLLNTPLATVRDDDAFQAQLLKDISVALQIRLTRIRIVSAEAGPTGADSSARIRILLSENVAPDPITAAEAAESFQTRSNQPDDYMFKLDTLQHLEPGTVTVQFIPATTCEEDPGLCAGTMLQPWGVAQIMLIMGAVFALSKRSAL